PPRLLRRLLVVTPGREEGHACMKRREFITLLGGAAAAWPLAAQALPGRMRRIGVLMTLTESDPEARAWVTALKEVLQKLGWEQDRNVRIDYRWSALIVSRSSLWRGTTAYQRSTHFVSSLGTGV